MKKLIRWFGTQERPHYGRLWLLFFIYPALVALLVQLVVLPYIFPAWNAGDGMLAGGDWYMFHLIAVNLAQKIHAQGWSVWQLRPYGQAPAGIAAAVYALIVPKPWTLIPLNAALHATAAMVLFLIMKSFLPDWRKALLTVFPFWLFPSAMIWYTQIHKDGYSIAGAFLFLYGWVLFAQNRTWERWWRGLLAMFLVFLGAGLVWVVRIYSVQMMQGVSVALALALTTIFVFRLAKKKLQWYSALAAIVVPWVVLIAMTPLTRGGIESEAPVTFSPAQPSQPVQPVQPVQPAQYAQSRWQSNGWPKFVEDEAYALALVRDGFTLGFPDAASNVDVGVRFRSVVEELAYLPRAVEIAFLAPFPSDWFGQGSFAQNTIMRRVSAFEMIGIYISLVLLPLAIWRWRRKPELWIVFIFCVGMMLIYALVVANVGTLYRFRYGFIMTLVAIGIAGGFSFWGARGKSAKV